MRLYLATILAFFGLCLSASAQSSHGANLVTHVRSHGYNVIRFTTEDHTEYLVTYDASWIWEDEPELSRKAFLVEIRRDYVLVTDDRGKVFRTQLQSRTFAPHDKIGGPTK
jgi:hypothetical protein